jgi:TolB-like protein/class 3 adenylate cyclase/Flp pilus assembly protein TadD
VNNVVSNQRLLVLMFTDLVGSSAMKTKLGDVEYANKVVRPHNRIFREIIASIPGAEENNYTGDGFLATFPRVSDAVNAALRFQYALRNYPWEVAPITTRIGIHIGETVLLEGSEAGRLLIASHAADMCARLMSLAQGGQTLLTRHAFDDARQYVRQHPTVPGCVEPPAIKWAAHGQYRFKGKEDPLEVFEVGAVDFAPLVAPPDSEKARRVRVTPFRPTASDSGDPQRREAIDSLAVLPLVSENPDLDTEYLADGISEGIINLLSQLPGLRVLARSTVFRYKGEPTDPQEVGRALHVRAVLIGRLLQRGNQVMIKTELVDAADGTHLWGQRFTWELAEIFTAEEAISRVIAGQLRLRLTSDERQRLARRHTENTEAYQLYLRGRYHWNKRTEDGFKTSIQHFEGAIAQDPAFALPWAGLADAYHQLGLWGNISPRQAYPKAKAAVQQALKLEPTLAEAHTTLARIKKDFDYDFRGALKDFQRAIELNPNYATAHSWYGQCLACMGRHSEAITELKRAQELDPLSLIINAVLGRHGFFFARRYEDAIDQCHKTLELDSGFWVGHMFLGLTYAHTGQLREALAEFQKARALHENLETLAGIGYAHALLGQRDEAQSILEELTEFSKQRYVMPINIAVVYVGLGDKDRAIAWLEKSYEDRNEWLSEVKADPTFDTLRSDIRFQDLLGRMGLRPSI